VPSVRSRRMGHYQIVDLRVRIANSLASVTAAQQLSDEVSRAVMREVQVSSAIGFSAPRQPPKEMALGVWRLDEPDVGEARRWWLPAPPN
jgi:hypothetical protein